MCLWKNTVMVLAPALNSIVNSSIQSGFVPTRVKTAVVSPIHKGGGKPRDDPASYRPVAVLNALSKLLEATVNKQLTDQLEERGALPSTQHGFRRQIDNDGGLRVDDELDRSSAPSRRSTSGCL